MFADDRIFKLRPQHARGIEQLETLANREPLVAARHARFILHGSFACVAALTKAVDERRFADIRHTDDHDADGSAHHALAFPRSNLLTQDVFNLRQQAV